MVSALSAVKMLRQRSTRGRKTCTFHDIFPPISITGLLQVTARVFPISTSSPTSPSQPSLLEIITFSQQHKHSTYQVIQSNLISGYLRLRMWLIAANFSPLLSSYWFPLFCHSNISWQFLLLPDSLLIYFHICYASIVTNQHSPFKSSIKTSEKMLCSMLLVLNVDR